MSPRIWHFQQKKFDRSPDGRGTIQAKITGRRRSSDDWQGGVAATVAGAIGEIGLGVDQAVRSGSKFTTNAVGKVIGHAGELYPIKLILD